MQIMAPISVGELFDKITILKIKEQRIRDPAKLVNVRNELRELSEIADCAGLAMAELDEPVADLHAINAELWDIEDAKRECERTQTFDEEFVRLARNVYLKNDMRADIKRRINMLSGSVLIEEKAHKGYRAGA